MDIYGRPSTQYNYCGNTPYMSSFQPQPQQMRTNKIFVTSLEDALNRYAEPNTVMVYRHQDEKYEYEIITDSQGKKNYKTLILSDNSAKNEPITQPQYTIPKDEIDAIKDRLKVLEDELLKKYKEERRKEKNGSEGQ